MRKGRQEPRVNVTPEYAYSDGEDAAELSAAYGYKLDPWQKLVLSAWLARDESDHYAATDCGLSVPRQNGKNALLEVRELYGMVTTGEKFLHTAHEVKTARKAFERLAGFFSNERMYPELASMVVSIRRTNGQESIVLTNGGSIEFSARSRGAARGFTVDTVVFDEAQELTDEQLEAILPTLAAAPSGNRQFIYTGTPPGPGSPGTVFGRTRKVSHTNPGTHRAWHEWSVEEIGDVTDVDRWYETNPAMGYRIDEDFCRQEMEAMSPDGFARERLGWWESTEKKVNHFIDAGDWKSCQITKDQALKPGDGKLAFGVKYDISGAYVACSVAVLPKSGDPAFVELVDVMDAAHGTITLADKLSQIWDKTSCILVDGKYGAAPLVQRLLDAGVPRRVVRQCRTTEMAAATAMFSDAITNKDLTHIESEALDLSVEGATKRPIGKSGAFGIGDGEDSISTPAESAALALYGVKTTKRDPLRRSVVRC